MKQTMPFSNEDPKELREILDFISNDDLRLELFDAFLSEYKSGASLQDSLFFARCEWDC